MKKKLIGILCGALVVAMAVPALADHKIGGYFRTQGYAQVNDGPVYDGETAHTETFVTQRLRMKWTNSINDYISVVWYGEVNNIYGKSNYLKAEDARYSGGGFGADGVNVQTKNAYADLKIPMNVDLSLRVGIQGLGDSIQSTFINQDVAGVTAKANFDMVGVTAGWAKAFEGDLDEQDDADLYVVKASFKASDTLSFGADLFLANDSADKSDLIVAGLYGKGSFGMATVDGFLAFQSNDDEDDIAADGSTGVSGTAIAATVGADFNLDVAKVGARIIYYSADDDENDDNQWANIGAFEFYKEGLRIFGTDIYNTGFTNDRKAFKDAALNGYGLLALLVKGSANIDVFYVKGVLGYFMALDDTKDNAAVAQKEGTDIGIELGVEVGMKVAEAATVSLRASYAMLGDFYDVPGSGAGTGSPDDMYMAALMLNIPY